jgi:flagellar motor switch protein FliN/FliY
MSTLSQDEIDRILNSASGEDADAPAGVPDFAKTAGMLMEAAGAVLHEATGASVETTVTGLKRQGFGEAMAALGVPMSGIEGAYAGGLDGTVLLMVSEQDAQLLSAIFGDEGALEQRLRAMLEAQDAVLTRILGADVNVSAGGVGPVAPEDPARDALGPFAVLQADAVIDGGMAIGLVQLLSPTVAEALKAGEQSASAPEPEPEKAAPERTAQASPTAEKKRETAPPPRRQEAPKSPAAPGVRDISENRQARVRRPIPQDGNLGIIIEMPLQLSVELGRVTMTIREILSFRTGSIIELNKTADDLVDVHVNNKCIARGEVVVVDENYGVRITDIIRPENRVESYR